MIKIKSMKVAILACVLAIVYASLAFATATPEEADQLGKTLTRFGAEKAGNKEGTIPAYTGGLTKAPANYKAGSGFRPDPFASEKPLFSVDARNMAQYTDKLTEGTKTLMKRFSTFRIDVYQTHRTVAYPDYVLENTVKSATKCATTPDGLGVKNARYGIPFPIPKTGYEAVWNHNLRYQGLSRESVWYTDLVDSSGNIYNVSVCRYWEDWPYYRKNLDLNSPFAQFYWKNKWVYDAPARKAGEIGMSADPINPTELKRRAYLYLPGQRRVKLAPQVSFDTPASNGNGNFTYDECWMYNGSMERYNMKLIGKKEMYIPYNAYKATYVQTKNGYYSPRHMNPDVLRWELHRVWVVEARLKPGARHIYKTQRFYIDEDSWAIVASETYDSADRPYKVNFMFFVQNYDLGTPCTMTFVVYNLNNGVYVVTCAIPPDGFIREDKARPDSWWSPDNLLNAGVR